jgi:hypothetical protein
LLTLFCIPPPCFSLGRTPHRCQRFWPLGDPKNSGFSYKGIYLFFGKKCTKVTRCPGKYFRIFHTIVTLSFQNLCWRFCLFSFFISTVKIKISWKDPAMWTWNKPIWPSTHLIAAEFLNFFYFPLLPVAKFGSFLLWTIATVPTTRVSFKDFAM